MLLASQQCANMCLAVNGYRAYLIIQFVQVEVDKTKINT